MFIFMYSSDTALCSPNQEAKKYIHEDKDRFIVSC